MFHKKLHVCFKASDGSSSRDDLPALLLRRNDQIRRLEAKLSGRRRKPASVVSSADRLRAVLLSDLNTTPVIKNVKGQITDCIKVHPL